MFIREAHVSDIPQIQRVRNAVKENRLSSPSVVSDEDCELYLTKRGKGWVAIIHGNVVAFAIADLLDHNIWALFVDPFFECQGIGKQLQYIMLHWYFSQTDKPVWLGTAPHTRAEVFYRRTGWIEAGMNGKSEVRFEMTFEIWETLQQNDLKQK